MQRFFAFGSSTRLVVAFLAAGAAAAASADAAGGKLLYQTIPPCRIVDTRVAGGAVGGNTNRTFNVVGSLNNFTGQGGQAGGCGIPGFSGGTPQVQAVAFNFVAVGPAGAGDLRAWPSDQAMPGASVLNYAAVAGLNIANGIIIPVRQDVEGNDVTVRADVSATHLVVDVVGFFSAATPRRFYLTPTGVTGGAATTACAAGFHMASLWEIFDTSNLQYDTTLGLTRADTGNGPPAAENGWIRNGTGSFTGTTAGVANCNAWTSSSAAVNGTMVALESLWAGTVLPISPWTPEVLNCGLSVSVWCVQD